jgi:hypothetical protein
MMTSRIRRYSQSAPVKQTTSATGMVIRTEAGVSVQGTAGAQIVTVT